MPLGNLPETPQHRRDWSSSGEEGAAAGRDSQQHPRRAPQTARGPPVLLRSHRGNGFALAVAHGGCRSIIRNGQPARTKTWCTQSKVSANLLLRCWSGCFSGRAEAALADA